jgi:putative DNA primase/helicase
MGDNTIIKNKVEFETTAQTFLDKIFNQVLTKNLGDIEIRTFQKGKWADQFFCQTSKQAAEIAFDLCNSGVDVYFGVNPRTGKAGKKENIQYVTAFHAEVDYGAEGHKKKSDYENYGDAIISYQDFYYVADIINTI